MGIRNPFPFRIPIGLDFNYVVLRILNFQHVPLLHIWDIVGFCCSSWSRSTYSASLDIQDCFWIVIEIYHNGFYLRLSGNRIIPCVCGRYCKFIAAEECVSVCRHHVLKCHYLPLDLSLAGFLTPFPSLSSYPLYPPYPQWALSPSSGVY